MCLQTLDNLDFAVESLRRPWLAREPWLDFGRGEKLSPLEVAADFLRLKSPLGPL